MKNEYTEKQQAFDTVLTLFAVIVMAGFLIWLMCFMLYSHKKEWCEKNKINAFQYFSDCRTGGEVQECAKLESIWDDYKKKCAR